MVIDNLAQIMRERNRGEDRDVVAHAVNAPVPNVFHVDRGTGATWVRNHVNNWDKVIDMRVHGNVTDADNDDIRVVTADMSPSTVTTCG
jgi:hypothetical protein